MKVGYAVLYINGTLVISKNHTLLQKSTIKDYGEFEDINVLWKNESRQIKKIQILNQVKANCMKEWFKGCINLTTLIDFKNLDVSDCTDVSFMFYDCQSLQDLIGLENWNTSSGTDFSCMFKYCMSLKDVNELTTWDVSNGIKFFTMFAYCESLQDLSGLEKWNISNGRNFSYMFESCKSLEYINDLQSWNISTCENFFNIFAYCKSLKEISLPDTLAILKLDMFDNCNSKLRIHWKKHIYSYGDLLEYKKNLLRD